MLTRLRVLAAVALVALLAAGCSSTEEEERADVDEAALRDGLVALWVGDDETAMDTATGECFADALLDAATPEQLRDAGILDVSYAVVDELAFLDEAGAGLWAEAQFACTDFVEESVRAQVAATKGRVDRDAYGNCLRSALTEDQQRAAAEQSLMGDLDGDAVAAFSAAQLTCVQQALPPD
ncbi:hypothetical protein [Nocardioides sp. cx-173]|uniref:hypothetical protein n=1 Tax=Nocardioides sp. cx-173 TaxID=2898796 RepID=UPI001E60C8FD|nr:hypothetical protein [Nocardioides sp. cx-173]MCD4523858.1 hypothetical protein [Nocardioides sp. cx-173]UGB41822.1 hypothetical protein LQ940_21040 [Nocardioides sp. cx-173]